MDDEHELAGITTLRLFPLPGVVFFPHCVLPLHIFEPRYREMTADALAGDRLVTIVMVRPGPAGEETCPAPLEEFGCVGRILQHERLPDGRFNFLLLGLKRVRLLHERPSGKLYRTADAEVVEDDETEAIESAAIRDELIAIFRRYLEPLGGVHPDLEGVLSSELPLGVLADILSHSLPMPASHKQRLLAEPRVQSRVASLVAWLRELADSLAKSPDVLRGFPPSFSAN